MDESPKPRVMLFDHTSDDGYKQMLSEFDDRALKKKREAGTFAHPRHLHSLHAMLVALYAREIGMDVSFVLEEVEMAPGSRRSVVRWKAFVAMVLRAGELPSTLEGNMDMQFHGRIFCGLEFHLRYAPRLRKVQSNGKQASCIHG